MKAILVGAGGIAREMLRRLGESWDVTVVDNSQDRLTQIEGSRASRTIEGDGSSRVVLKRAGLEEADALVAATNDDEANLEACRLALEAGVSRLVAVAADPERRPDYRELGVTAISPDSLAARRIELSLETRRVSSMAFADGRAEAIEFRIAQDSPVRGKALRDLHAKSWIVGAILRGNELLIPHGNTVLLTDDLVTVVGAGADFAEMVRTFTSGQAGFPMDFGKHVAVTLDSETQLEGTIVEATHLVRNSRASSLLVVHRDPEPLRDEALVQRLRRLLERSSLLTEDVEMRHKPVRGRPSRAILTLASEESIGVIVIGAHNGNGGPLGRAATRAANLVQRTGRPVLLSRGSHPYGRIVVPARRTRAGRAAVRVGIDLARFSKSRLQGVAVVDPVFISGPVTSNEARHAIAWLEEEAAVHGVDVDGAIRRGNPVRQLVHVSRDADLMVLGIPVGRRRRFLRVCVGSMVARRASGSVLLVPVTEDL